MYFVILSEAKNLAIRQACNKRFFVALLLRMTRPVILSEDENLEMVFVH